MLPTFIIIGAAKCGTTTICRSLGSHPDVFISEPKEPHYFSRLPDSNNTPLWYESLFSEANGYYALGEASTSYTAPNRIRRAAKRLAQTIPHCKLIYVVRNPIKRLESDWKMRRREGWTPACINEAVISQPELITTGLYWHNISIYRNIFPDSHIKVIFLEDFARNPRLILKECFSYIGVNVDVSNYIELDQQRNDSNKARKIIPLVQRLINRHWWIDIKDTVPLPLKNAAKTIFSREYEYKIEWDPKLLESVIQEQREDAAQFLDFYGKPSDFWDLESSHN